MLKLNDFRIGWRQLWADPAYSAIVILGLAVAVSSCYLIMALLVDAMLPDPVIAQPARVVALDFKPNIPDRKLDWTGGAPFVLRDALLTAKAPVTKVARTMKNSISVKSEQNVAKIDAIFSDAEITGMFGLRALSGDITATLTQPDSVALTELAAERIYGKRDVLGSHLVVNGKTLTVTAMLPRQNGNSQLQFEALLGFDSIANGLPKEEREGWYSLNGRVYANLLPGASAEQIGRIAQALFDNSPVIKEVPPGWVENGRKAAFLRAVSMDRLAFDGAGSSEKSRLYGGLAAAALAMLGLACVNYVNLTTVRTLNRQREIGVRKSLGASPAKLAAQLISESMLVALLAGAVGLGLALLLAPSFADLLDYRFDNRLFTVGKLIALIVGCIVLGLVTGLYPARIALNINCAQSLSGRNHSENASGRWVRRAMTTLQFGAAMTLSAMAIVVLWQNHHVIHMDNGFRSEGLLAISLPATADPQAASAFHDALAREPGVQALAWSDSVPGRNAVGSQESFSSKADNPAVPIRVNTVNARFFEVYQIPLLAGKMQPTSSAGAKDSTASDSTAKDSAAHNSAVDQSVVLDRTAAKLLGFGNPQDAIGENIKDGSGKYLRVVAVIEKVRQETAHIEASPQLFFLNDKPFGTGAVLTVRTMQFAAVRKALEIVWKRQFPNEVVVMDTVDSYLAEHYKQDRTIGIVIAAASFMALLLASLGVYSLAAYTVRIKTREIVLRKLYGAGPAAIAGILVREFGILLGVGVLIGIPLAFIASNQYLASYVERAPIGIWALLAAVVVTSLMAALAALRHTLAAMAIRPILALQG
jgi:putative ABC transport system permease protein